ncbi:MAG: hypothetical protein H6605_08290 [Flavobacteriales bacterium]|nr:hypothetical protein [Flavobacteriales bacterium]
MKEFEKIRPYYDKEVQEVVQKLIQDEMFNKLVRYIWPDISQETIQMKAKRIKTAFDFQLEFMHGAINEIVKRSSTGLSYSGFENIEKGNAHLFISNHRDIMLDSAILQTILVDEGHETSEITFGDNLMTPGFITEFGKINRMFTVQREGNSKELYEISKNLSAYIRHTISEKKVSIWIAQRNGRTKDGNDFTQTGLLKMLNISNQRKMADGFKQLNILPMSISYEYEPCDFLKVRESYLSSLHTVYKKDADEDIKSIVKGIEQPKGRIHISLSKLKDEEVDEIKKYDNDNEKIKVLTQIIDKKIHGGYRLFKTNYIAYDLLKNSSQYDHFYSKDDLRSFKDYIENGLKKIEINNPETINLTLQIYANPVINKMGAGIALESI